LKAVSVVSIIIILMRLAGHVTCMEERRVLVGKPEGRNHLEDAGMDGDNIKIDLQ
jgi:hypothetical protein